MRCCQWQLFPKRGAHIGILSLDLGVGLKMVKAGAPGARLKMVKVPRLPDPYLPPVIEKYMGL